MKSLILFAMLFPFLSFAQTIPRNTNAFILSGISKNEVKQSLIKMGFTAIDHDSLSFVTLPRQYRDVNHGNMILQVQQEDTLVVVTGTYNTNDNTILDPNGNVYYRIERSRGWSYCREFFEKLNKIILSITPKIAYVKL